MTFQAAKGFQPTEGKHQLIRVPHFFKSIPKGFFAVSKSYFYLAYSLNHYIVKIAQWLQQGTKVQANVITRPSQDVDVLERPTI